MQSGPNSERIRGMRMGWIATTLLLAAFSCSDDDAADPQTEDAAKAANQSDASSDEPKDELREIFAASIEAYDRQVESHCPCFVQNGAYETVEECLGWQKSGDDWVSCGTEAIRPHDSPELRENLRCVKERADNNTECNNAIACESPERASCSENLLLCFAQMSDIVLVLDDKCPDFSLLPRQQARADAGTE
jgi:hypothetical protein